MSIIWGKQFYAEYKAWDGAPVTGDVENHTIRLLIDGTITVPTNSPEEIDATYAPGLYRITVTDSEAQASEIRVTGTSSTVSVDIFGESYDIEGPDSVSIKEALKQGYIHGDNAIVVAWAASDADRGSNLKSAYAAAKSLTPGGNSISSVNRAYVILPPWHYDIGLTELDLSFPPGIDLDTNYIDLVALFPECCGNSLRDDLDLSDGTTSLDQCRPQSTFVYSNSVYNSIAFQQSAQYVNLHGFGIGQLQAAPFYGNPRSYYCDADTNDGSCYRKMYSWNIKTGGNHGGWAFRRHCSGLWIECCGNAFSWRLGGGDQESVFSATMFDCIGGHSSYIGDTVEEYADLNYASGCYLYNCKQIGKWSATSTGTVYDGHAFAGCTNNGVNVDETCEFWYCEAGDRSFGLGMDFAGKCYHCIAGIESFSSTTVGEYSGIFSGYAYKCVGGANSFGGNRTGRSNGKCTGTVIECIVTGNTEPHRLEGAIILDSVISMDTTDKDCITLLDSNSKVHNNTLLVVEGGTGIPINASSAQDVSATNNKYNNYGESTHGLGDNVTNVGTTDIHSPFSYEITDDVWDESLTGSSHNIPTSSGRRLRDFSSSVIITGTSPNTNGTANTSIRIELDNDASSTDGAYDPSVIQIINGTGAGQSRQIWEYDGTNKYAYINRDWKVTPDDTSEYVICANSGDTHVNEGVAAGGTSTTIVLNDLASSHDNCYNGQIVLLSAGTGQDQAQVILDYVGSTRTATVSGWNTIPVDGETMYAILPFPIYDNDGNGARTVVITVNDGSDVLESASIRLSKGAATYVLKTNSSGQATFNLDDGTYTVAISLTGYTYSGTTLVVDGDESQTYSIDAITISDPSSPSLCTVQFRVKLSDDNVSGAVCKAKLLGINQASDGTILSNEELSDTTDSLGIAELQLVRKGSIVKGSGIYNIVVEINGNPVASVETTIPNQSTILFEDLLK